MTAMTKRARVTLAAMAMAVLGMAASAPTQAALVQTTTPSLSSWFDTTLSGAALIYDANFYSASQGRLVVLAQGSSLAGPGVPTSAPGQVYLGAGDQIKDLVIEMRINNANGALISGSVFMPRSNDGGPNDSWTFAGSITQFGFSDFVAGNTTNTFDARWSVASYDFSDVVANPSLAYPAAGATCTNGACGAGYLRINAGGIAHTSSTAGAPVNFGIDWVRGAGVISGTTPNAQLGAFDDGIAASAYSNLAVTSDVFLTPVPLPAPFLLLGAGLLVFGSLARRRAAAR